jgi:hypothetical protein
MDPVLHAYATLALNRGCSLSVVKRQYRSLVKRWHPDRFASDPVGARQAGEQLQAINRAFRIVAEDLKAVAEGGGQRANSPGATGPEGGRPLTRSEIDAITTSLGTKSPVDVGLDWLTRNGPFFLAALLLWRPHMAGPVKPLEALAGLSCACWGLAMRFRRSQR